MPMRRAIIAGVSWLTFAFLLLPLLVVVGVSVTETAYLKFPPQGFTLKWYLGFFQDPTYVEAFYLSVKLGVASTSVAKRQRRSVQPITSTTGRFPHRSW